MLVIMKLYSLRISLNSYKCTNPSEKGKREKGEEDISGSVSKRFHLIIEGLAMKTHYIVANRIIGKGPRRR